MYSIFPEHIVNLAQAELNGDNVESILADALEELGLYACANHYRDLEGIHHADPVQINCFLSRALIGEKDFGEDWWSGIWMEISKEVIEYRRTRRLVS